MSEEQEYFKVKCPKCGWEGSSEHSAGGGAIADTGDYSDLICPKCFKEGYGDAICLEYLE